MECNKDEALRSKEIAERKFKEREFAGAQKFALKAQTLYPGLEGISHMLNALEVYISAGNKVNGEMDMYGILGVNPNADDETIKKHYRKRVLLLHPDKNKFAGADGAFQLVAEAFSLLSDKAKRSAYNTRRNMRTTQQKVAPQSGVSMRTEPFRQYDQKVSFQGGASVAPPNANGPCGQKTPTQGNVSGTSKTAGKNSTTPGSSSSSQNKAPPQSGISNGFHKQHANNIIPKEGSQKKSSKKPSPAPSRTQRLFSKESTFWTVCTRCKMQYEYTRFYLNHNLNCPHCKVGFKAVEVPPPSNLASIRCHEQQQKTIHHNSSSGSNRSGSNYSYGVTGARWSPHSGTTYGNIRTCSMSGVTQRSQPTNVSQGLVKEAKRGLEEAASGSAFREEVPSKKRKEDDISSKNFGVNIPSHTPKSGNGGFASVPGQYRWDSVKGMNIFQQGQGTYSSKFNYDANRELSQAEVRKMLSEKALGEIRGKLQEWKISSELRTFAKKKENLKQQNLSYKSKLMKNHVNLESKKSLAGNTKQEVLEMIDMNVPDPDFHIFDLDRTEKSFRENQVWATYDDEDGMPRYYALIHEVISLNPFELRISWLNSKTNTEFGDVSWVDRGNRKTCGEFWVGKHVKNELLNSFSQNVKWTKGPRGVIQIYPRRGEVWALYKNWSPDWNKNTPYDIRHVYDMVEVINDYNGEQDVRVTPLTKAPGFRTVFFKQPDSKVIQIPKGEMFRFSHQVPSHLLTGEEKPNAPAGYLELDPAAIPTELLQVTPPNNPGHVTHN